MQRWLLAALLPFAATAVVSAGEPPPAHLGVWNFRALLDGSPIGEHRFTVTGDGDERKVTSVASFDVKFLMITAYRYRHQATERWRGDCLETMSAETNDDGKTSKVQADRNADGLAVRSADGTQKLPGCVMSFAYWNPDIRTQSSLLNAQTGRYETVNIERVGNGRIEVRGQSVAATQFRITGPAQPIDIWYSPKGEWLGLDSIVADGRKLSYRLE